MRVVYVVLEAQYQSSLTAAVRNLNATRTDVAYEVCACLRSRLPCPPPSHPPLSAQVVGYLLEELRDARNYAEFQKDCARCNLFIGSLIFIEELADKVVAAVTPHRDTMDACLIFPSMPAVMKLNKLGTFSMAQLGQSKSAIASFMKKKREESGSGFEESMLKLVRGCVCVCGGGGGGNAQGAPAALTPEPAPPSQVRTLPKVLKYLPSDKAQDARNFMLSLQYWLGGNAENLENFLLSLTKAYVPAFANAPAFGAVAEPVTYPDVGIWHPMAPAMFEDVKEYLNWYDTRKDASFPPDAPVVGLVLQRSHLVTGDEGHYSAVVAELEARGARVVPVFAGGLDFSIPVDKFFFSPLTKLSFVDAVLSLTGFALVGGPARQDHPRAIEALKRLNVPYMVSLPLVFQTTEEWVDSSLGLHPVQVALQVALPELDGGIEPIVFSGRDSKTGKSHSLYDRVEAVAERAIKWAALRKKTAATKRLAITVFSFPPDKGNVGTAAYLNVFGSIFRVLNSLKADGYDLGDSLPATEGALIESVLHDKEAKFASPDLNVAYRMPVPEYERLCDYSEALHENWGKPARVWWGGVGHTTPLLHSSSLAPTSHSNVHNSQLSLAAWQPELGRAEHAGVRQAVWQRVHWRAADVWLRGRPHAPALLQERLAPPRLRRVLHVRGEGVQG